MSGSTRSYGEGCIAAHALDLVGDRWTLLIARELMLGPKRFGAVQAGLPGIATNMLSRRLSDMEAAGLLTRRAAPAPVSATVYALTAAGESLWPVLAALCEVGRRLPGHDPRLPISPTALMLSMRCTLVPARAAAAEGRSAGFVMAGESFQVAIRTGRLETARADPPAAEVVLAGPPNLMAAVVYGAAPLARHAGAVSVEGDLARAQAFVDCFSLAP